MTSFYLPDLGEGLQDAEIVSWHVAEGDRVVANQPLVAVETQKAVVEVPSPRSGRIIRLYGSPGDIIDVGAKLVDFDEAARDDKGSVVGELPGMKTRSVKAPPAVRARAKELGIELTGVAGTGPGGSITIKDLNYAGGSTAASPPPEPLRGARRAMARNMSHAGTQVVPATLTGQANIDHWPQDSDNTIHVIRAIAAGVKMEPALNAWFDGQKMTRQLHPHVDLGLAMDTLDGLFVPSLRDITSQSDKTLRNNLERLKKDVKARTVSPEDLRGQTITLSNFGMIGGHHSAMVVMPPQVAILGVGQLEPHAVVVNGKVRAARIMPLSLTFDHRAVTGGEAGRFFNAVIEELEKPKDGGDYDAR